MSTDPRSAAAPVVQAETSFARTPEPPYYAVIFTTTQTDDSSGYGAMAVAMEALAAQQPGYLGIESARSDGLGITVSYWTDETAIAAWRNNVLHTTARDQGRAQWYAHYELRVAKVERASSWDRADEDRADEDRADENRAGSAEHADE